MVPRNHQSKRALELGRSRWLCVVWLGVWGPSGLGSRSGAVRDGRGGRLPKPKSGISQASKLPGGCARGLCGVLFLIQKERSDYSSRRLLKRAKTEKGERERGERPELRDDNADGASGALSMIDLEASEVVEDRGISGAFRSADPG